MGKRLYKERDVEGLRHYYSNHVGAMTKEGLHNKSDIAAELAYRDARIAELEAKLSAADRLLEAVGQAVDVTVTPISGPYIQSNFSVTPADFPAIKDAIAAYTQTKETDNDFH